MSAHDFSFTSIDGKPLPLSQFAGGPVLIVNTASRCGMTPQYEGLQTLWEQYRDRGFTVLGVPSNDFGSQEPGTEAEILEFVTSKFDVDFPMFSKIEVNGDGAAPLYRWLKQHQPGDGDSAEVTWNLEKFLVDEEGNAVARFSPQTTPEQVAEVLDTYR